MNRYMMIHRLTGPCILLLLGVVALLHEAHLVRWTMFWPLLLILIGVLKLAERAALAAEGGYPMGPMPGAVPAVPQAPETPSTSMVPTHTRDFGNESEGGQQ